MTDDPRAAAFELVLQARNDAELVRVTKERDDANREADFQHARAAKFADMLKAAPPAEGPTWQPTDPSRAKPGPFTTAVVLCADGKMRVLTRTYRGEWMDDLKHGSHFVVTHWLDAPLPTPPRDPAGKE